MADGTLKLIENVEIGDQVLDAFGNPATIDGISISQLRTNDVILRINDSLVIVEDKPLFSTDEKFHVFRSIEEFNNKIKPSWRWYIVGKNILKLKPVWLDPAYMAPLSIGNQIKTVTGFETIVKIEEINHPEDFNDKTIYKHSTTGSGTYFVDGYCVASRINETWDYINSVPEVGTVTIIDNTDLNVYEKKIDLDMESNYYPYWNSQKSMWIYP